MSEPKPTLASLEIQPDIEEHTVIRESDLPRHFNNGKEIKPKQPGRTEGETHSSPATDNKAKPGSPEAAREKPAKDVQLAKAIDVLKHWDSLKGQLAKNDSDNATKP